MQIERHGTAKYRGPSKINIIEPKVSWNRQRKAIQIKKGGVKDFSTTSRHDYVLTLEMEDLVSIVDAIATEGLLASFEEVVAGLSPALRSLLRITNAQTVVVPPSSLSIEASAS